MNCPREEQWLEMKQYSHLRKRPVSVKRTAAPNPKNERLEMNAHEPIIMSNGMETERERERKKERKRERERSSR